MTAAPITRATLLIRLRDGADRVAWQEFTELYAPVIYRRFRQQGLQDADAADLTQEVMRGVAIGFRQWEYDPARGTFRGWLFAIARNKLHDHFRQRQRQPAGTGDSATLDLIEMATAVTDSSDRWEEEYQHQLFAVAAEAVKKSCEESTWGAFWQTAVRGIPASTVAESLGLSVGSVYVAKTRIVARIRKQIAQIEGDQS